MMISRLMSHNELIPYALIENVIALTIHHIAENRIGAISAKADVNQIRFISDEFSMEFLLKRRTEQKREMSQR